MSSRVGIGLSFLYSYLEIWLLIAKRKVPLRCRVSTSLLWSRQLSLPPEPLEEGEQLLDDDGSCSCPDAQPEQGQANKDDEKQGVGIHVKLLGCGSQSEEAPV